MPRGGRVTPGSGTHGMGPRMAVVRIGSTLARLKICPGGGQTLGIVGTARGLGRILPKYLVKVLEFENVMEELYDNLLLNLQTKR